MNLDTITNGENSIIIDKQITGDVKQIKALRKLISDEDVMTAIINLKFLRMMIKDKFIFLHDERHPLIDNCVLDEETSKGFYDIEITSDIACAMEMVYNVSQKILDDNGLSLIDLSTSMVYEEIKSILDEGTYYNHKNILFALRVNKIAFDKNMELYSPDTLPITKLGLVYGNFYIDKFLNVKSDGFIFPELYGIKNGMAEDVRIKYIKEAHLVKYDLNPFINESNNSPVNLLMYKFDKVIDDKIKDWVLDIDRIDIKQSMSLRDYVMFQFDYYKFRTALLYKCVENRIKLSEKYNKR